MKKTNGLTRDEKRKAYNYIKKLTGTTGKSSRDLNTSEECDNAILELIAKVNSDKTYKSLRDINREQNNEIWRLKGEIDSQRNAIDIMSRRKKELEERNDILTSEIDKLTKIKWWQFWK